VSGDLPWNTGARAPQPGEDNPGIYAEIGLGEEDLLHLTQARVI
jgi:hypothetical protein